MCLLKNLKRLFRKYRVKKGNSYCFGDFSRVSGIENIQVGKNFSAARFLWLHAVTDYPFADQHFNPVIKIGDNVSFSELVHIGAINSVIIGNNVLIGSKVLIEDHNHGSYSGDQHDSPDLPPIKRKINSPGGIIIEDNVWICDNVTILGNVRIGFGSIIAANSLIHSGTVVPPGTIFGGNPAKIIKKFDSLQKKWVKSTEY